VTYVRPPANWRDVPKGDSSIVAIGCLFDQFIGAVSSAGETLRRDTDSLRGNLGLFHDPWDGWEVGSIQNGASELFFAPTKSNESFW
jgi:hypothetical protein